MKSGKALSSLGTTLFLSMFLASTSIAGQLPGDTCGEVFAQKIEGCQKFECKTPHPLASNFLIEKKILGPSEDRCLYEETMPGGGLMECSYRKESLKIVKEMWEAWIKTGAMKTQTAFDPIKSGECRVTGYGQ